MRIAAVIDGLDESGHPYIAENHPRVDEEERAALVRYLEAGTIVLHAPMWDPDILAPGSSGRVPVFFATDGEYVWSGDVAYYLSTYGISPDEDFLVHLRARVPDLPRAVDESAIQSALDLINGGDPV